MRFLYPLGLLGLIAIPILILIYILKRKYREETISSTYLWNLTYQFLKKRKPLHKLNSLLSLILQIIAIAVLSISLAHPVFYVKDGAENLCFIVDASGSMNILQDNQTRFDVAKKEMTSIINKSHYGSTYTIIIADIETKTLVKKSENREDVNRIIQDLSASCSYTDLKEAIHTAQDLFTFNEVNKIYLFTDKNYEHTENIEVFSISNHVENYAITSFNQTTQIQDKNKITLCQGHVISYENDAILTLNLKIDDEIIDTQEIEVFQGVETEFSFPLNAEQYEKITIEIGNKDALLIDNYWTLYNLKAENHSNILLVSKEPFYFNSMLNAIGNVTIDVVSPSSYVLQENYDIYIYDGFTPTSLPSKGTIWLVNTSQNVEDSGFIVQEEFTTEKGIFLEYAEESTSLYQQLTKDIKNNRILVKKYQKYSLYRNFTPILNYENLPMVFVGANSNGQREVVFSFDLHHSDFPLQHDFAPIMRNLLNYSNPAPVEIGNYIVGDTLLINVLNGTENIRITTPNNKVSFPNFDTTMINYQLLEIGTYTIEITLNGKSYIYHVFVSFDNKESIPYQVEESVVLAKFDEIKKNNGIFDNLFIIIIGFALFFLADWVVYLREQY